MIVKKRTHKIFGYNNQDVQNTLDPKFFNIDDIVIDEGSYKEANIGIKNLKLLPEKTQWEEDENIINKTDPDELQKWQKMHERKNKLKTSQHSREEITVKASGKKLAFKNSNLPEGASTSFKRQDTK